MKNLAIDTSSEVCGVCILEDDKIIDDNSLSNGMTHSENLMPLISEVLKKNNIKLKDVNLISCVVGPGSFTGIRIGVASIKALSEISNIPIAEVTSLELLAENVKESTMKVSIIDARNDQVYAGIFDEKNNLKEELIADSIENIIEKLKNYSELVAVGNGALKHRELLESKLKIKICEDSLQKAEYVGKIGYRKYLNGNIKNADELMPIYLRKSQAERLKK